jgi:ferrochelatase
LTRGILWLSFGAPERPEDLWEFLERVTRGRNVPRERLAVVREQYLATGGASPLNRQNLELIERLGAALATRGFEVPIYFGNRNWDPLVADTVRTMHADGITDALVIPTSAFSSYSGCRQYREDLAGAHAPFATLKLQPYGTLPAYHEAVVDALTGFLDTRGLGSLADTVVFTTAHSIPVSMAEASRYVPQLEALTEHLAEVLGERRPRQVRLVYQSRSGDPRTPWLEPDVADAIAEVPGLDPGAARVLVVPIGFISDHQEVRYDLDIEAAKAAGEVGLGFERAPTVSASGKLIELLADLATRWLEGDDPNELIPEHDLMCHETCCRLAHG